MTLFVAMFACSDDEAVLAGLASANPAVREVAVVDAAEVEDERVTKALIGLLEDPDARIRRGAADALAQIGDPQAVAALSTHVADADPDVARASIDALGRLGDVAAGPALVAAIQGNASAPPLNAIWALGACDVDSAEPLLASLRSHSDPWVRFNANTALMALSED